MAPWSLYAIGALRPGSDRFLRFCAVWFGVVFVFYTLGSAKLPHYVLAAVPPLAILIADRIGRTRPRARVRWPGVVATSAIVAVVAHTALTIYYYGFDVRLFGRQVQVSGFHAELHALARWVRTQGGPVAAYQMPRRTADRGTGGARLMETSHPSLAFYLNESVLDTDRLDELLAHAGPIWIITRANRIGPLEIERAQASNRALTPVRTPMRQDVYRLYRLF
jgi:4-amino-4-deoxy-L-arabinose transferase-like glycosyltransferase